MTHSVSDNEGNGGDGSGEGIVMDLWCSENVRDGWELWTVDCRSL